MESTVFMASRTQAVRLPKAVALPDDVKRVEILVVGRARLITPAGESWDSWFDGPTASADFASDRDQPAEQQREAL